MSTKTSPRLGRAIQIIWIAGFLIGTASHILDLVTGGVDTYAGFPSALRVFWVSLTFLDVLAVLLLLLKRRSGIVVGLGIILVDIAVNWTVYFTIGGNPLFGVVNQSVFAIVLAVTAIPLGRWMRDPREVRTRGLDSARPENS